ncbi:hypothetical protein PanWU01x14_020830, partial [Parasponia andersonii]
CTRTVSPVPCHIPAHQINPARTFPRQNHTLPRSRPPAHQSCRSRPYLAPSPMPRRVPHRLIAPCHTARCPDASPLISPCLRPSPVPHQVRHCTAPLHASERSDTTRPHASPLLL